MHAPQIIMICLWVFLLTASLIQHGKRRQNPNISFWEAVVGVGVSLTLLLWGGFFG